MKKFLFALLCLICVSDLSAQDDTTKLVYDVIYMKDGRVFKGEILSFNENNGTIIFKNNDGSKYTFKAEEYDRYKENVAYDAKKDFELRPRKESGLEFQVGFSAAHVGMNPNLVVDDYYLSGGYLISSLVAGVKIGVGTYLNRQNFIGGSVELGFTSSPKNYLSAGFRYLYQYDGYKKNVAFYLPIEAHFTSMKGKSQYKVADTSYFSDGSIAFDFAYRDVDVKFSMASVSLGQGFSFILNNKKAVGVEISFIKYFVLISDVLAVPKQPKTDFTLNGFKLALLYSI